MGALEFDDTHHHNDDPALGESCPVCGNGFKRTQDVQTVGRERARQSGTMCISGNTVYVH